MVIVRIKCGLGNQLFEYVLGRRIALANKSELKLDLSAYDEDSLRGYRLDSFNIDADIASPAEIARVTGFDRRGVSGRLWRLCQSLKPYHKRSIIAERWYHFDPDVLRVSGDVYIDGYWQSEKYFEDIKPVLKEELTFKNAPDAVNQALISRIANTSSVCLHVRRGDYVTDPSVRERFGVCTPDYYYSGIDILKSRLDNPELFVFSDDPDWVKANLRTDCPTTYVTHNGPEKDCEDLLLMSQCKHHIIANSSFSWWGAWLCSNPDQIVVAPKNWCLDPSRDAKDVVPDGWLRI